MQSDFYVYELAYPESMGGKVFYVGKGKGVRIDDHEREAARQGKNGKSKSHNLHKVSVILKIWAAGEQVVKRKVLTGLAEDEAYQEEMRLIAHYGRKNLTNHSDGGDGAVIKPEGERRINMGASLSNERDNLLYRFRRAYRLNHGHEPTEQEIREEVRPLIEQAIRAYIERAEADSKAIML